MTLIINLVLIVFVIKRIYWFNRYGTIRKADIKRIKREIKLRSSDAAIFYYGTAEEMIRELYPNAPFLQKAEVQTIVSHFIAKKDPKVPDCKVWDEVIGDYLLDKQRQAK